MYIHQQENYQVLHIHIQRKYFKASSWLKKYFIKQEQKKHVLSLCIHVDTQKVLTISFIIKNSSQDRIMLLRIDNK